MPVLFEIPSALNRYSNGLERLELTGSTVGEVLEDLFARYPPLRTRVLDDQRRLYPYLLLFLNDSELDRDGMLAAAVSDGDRLELIAAAEGG